MAAEVQHDCSHAGAGRQLYHGGGYLEPGGDATGELLPPGDGTVPCSASSYPRAEGLRTHSGQAEAPAQAQANLQAFCCNQAGGLLSSGSQIIMADLYKVPLTSPLLRGEPHQRGCPGTQCSP